MSDRSDPLEGLVDDLPDSATERGVERSTTEILLGRVYEHSEISEDEFDVLLDLVAHEIRTPFALIEGQARLLLGGAGDGGTDRMGLRSIHRNAVLGLLLLERLTDLRSVDEGRIVLHRLSLDVATHVRRTVEVLDDVVLGRRSVEVHTGDEVEPIICDVDPGRLRQIIFNLLANAALNTPPGAPINVEISREDGEVAIEVRDDGHGVAPEEVDDLFEKFPRLDAARQGPGVGLYVSRGLARAHGGDLRAVAVDGSDQGIFVLTLPCDPPG